MFVKYPHTPHLVWLGEGHPRLDKVLPESDRTRFLDGELVIEEKVDGANLGFSLDGGVLAVQNRGEYLRRPAHVQFAPLWGWIETHRQPLVEALGNDLILFGEWCFATHSVRYESLPDWFLGFDVYDRTAAKFWSADRRNDLLRRTGLCAIAQIGRGRYDLSGLEAVMGATRSQYGSGPVEGLYLRRESGGWLEQRAKIVRAEFTQAIQEHWSGRPIRQNRLRAAN